MQAKRLTLGLVVVAGLILGGCGGTEAEEGTGPELEAQESAIWPCDGTLDFSIFYYSDAARTQWVGTEACSCDGNYSMVGKRTVYQEATSFYCG